MIWMRPNSAKAKKFDVELFRRRLCEVESHEEQENVGYQEDNLFVELIRKAMRTAKLSRLTACR